MNTISRKNFYLFKGSWIDHFDELARIIQTGTQQQFVIWEPRDRNKDHNLIIVYGAALPQSYCFKKNIWKTDETIFDTFYQTKINQFRIHSK